MNTARVIGLGDFAPEGATEISPGQAKRSPGFVVCSFCALNGRRSIEGQSPAPLRGAAFRWCVTGGSAPLAPANFLRPFRARAQRNRRLDQYSAYKVQSLFAPSCGSLLPPPGNVFDTTAARVVPELDLSVAWRFAAEPASAEKK